MGEIRGIESNKPLLSVSQYLRKPRDFLNKGFVSDPFGEEDWRLGFGDLLFGEAPEVLEDAAYGWMPTEGSGQTLRLKPEVVDVAALPTFGAGAGARATIRALRKPRHGTLSKALVPTEETIEEAPDLSRRKFLKGMGAVGAVAGAAALTAKASIPDLLRRAVSEEDIAKAALKRTAGISRQALEKELTNMAKENIAKRFELHVGLDAKYPSTDRTYNNMMRFVLEDMEADPDLVKGLYTEDELASIEELLQHMPEGDTPENALRRLLADENANYDVIKQDPRMGTKSSWHNRHDLTEEEQKLQDKVREMVWDMTGDEMDMWHLRGELPERFTEEMLPYVDPTQLAESGGKVTAWDNHHGMDIDPASKVELNYWHQRRLQQQAVQSHYDAELEKIANSGDQYFAKGAKELQEKLRNRGSNFMLKGKHGDDFTELMRTLPDNISTEEIFRIANAGADAPLGGKADPRMGTAYDKMGHSSDYNKSWEARQLLKANWHTPDIDRWLITGEKPDWFPDELLPYVGPETIRDNATLFGNVTGSPGMDPYSLVDSHIEGILPEY